MGRVSLSALAAWAVLLGSVLVLVLPGSEGGCPSLPPKRYKTIDSMICSGIGGDKRCDRACRYLHCGSGGFCRISPIITYELALSGNSGSNSRSSSSGSSESGAREGCCGKTISVERLSVSETSASDESGEEWECMCWID